MNSTAKAEKAGDMSGTTMFLMILLTVASMLFSAFVFWKLYQWFIMPAGLPDISYAHAFGVWMFMRFATDNNNHSIWIIKDALVPADYATDVKYTLMAFVAKVILLGIGKLAHTIM